MIEKKPLHLGVIFDQQSQSGGGFQQSITDALALSGLSDELVKISYIATSSEGVSNLASYGIKAKIVRLSKISTLISLFNLLVVHLSGHFGIGLRKRLDRLATKWGFESELVRQDIDLVYFLSPSKLALQLNKLNYIITVWDLCHRDHPEFPEVRFGFQYEAREQFFNRTLSRAMAVFVDSDVGARNLSRRYAIDEKRIFVIPFRVSQIARKEFRQDKRCGSLPSRLPIEQPYIFYPAQFWAHKNHVYILNGLCCLERIYGKRINAIFAGADYGNQEYVECCIRELGLEGYVKVVGFVSDEEVNYLYRNSLAVVMPSYFGPTNLPPLEAFRLGVPLLYSNLDGMREQVQGAALLMDLSAPESMAKHLNDLLESEDLRNSLISEGYRVLRDMEAFDPTTVLRQVLDNFRQKRVCWGSGQ